MSVGAGSPLDARRGVESDRVAGALPVPILMYHSISNRASDRFKVCTVSKELFAEQMAYLSDHHFQAITVTQFVNCMANPHQALPERPVVLTFDDGYADFYTTALPIMQRFGFTATVYVTTAFVGHTARWLESLGEGARPMLSWEQLLEVNAAGVECGAHSHTHPQLDVLTGPQARQEVVRCKEVLEQKLSREVATFAYPYGYYDTGVRAIVQEAGYSSACAVRLARSSTADDPFALARIMVEHDTTGLELSTSLAGRGLPTAPTTERLRSQLYTTLRRSAGRLRRRLPRGKDADR